MKIVETIKVVDPYFDDVEVKVTFKKSKSYRDEFIPRRRNILCAIQQGLNLKDYMTRLK